MRQAKKRSKPQLIQAMIDVFKQPDIRSKLLFTFLILVIYRVIYGGKVSCLNLTDLGNQLKIKEEGLKKLKKAADSVLK